MDTFDLNDEQKALIIKIWNENSSSPPSLTKLTQDVFGQEFDGRSKYGRAIKKYLATYKIIPRAAQVYVAKEKLDLTDEQKEFIQNNYQNTSCVEMAKIIFNNNSITNLNIESITVSDYIKSQLGTPKNTSSSSQESENGWKPPNTLDRAVARVNKYVLNGINRESITNRIKKEVESLIGYLHNFRFINQINSFETEKDKVLFESTFIRYTYDKSDLTEEEVDQYILLATEAVMANRIQARSERLQGILDNQTNEDGEENARIAMSLVEAIGKAQQEYNSCVKRQQDLVNSLKQKRSDRLGKQLKENASILNLIEYWKDEQKRNQLLRIGEMQKKALEEEVDRLSSMEDVKTKIFGLTKNEAING